MKKLFFLLKNSHRISIALSLVSILGHSSFAQNSKKDTISLVQVLDIATKKIDTIYSVNRHFEAPNWHKDGYLILNSYGKLYTLNLQSRIVAELNTGFANECNNDHGLSPDHQWIAISHNNRADTAKKPYKSSIYIMPVKGGTPKLITSYTPSYWHGWSRDGNFWVRAATYFLLRLLISSRMAIARI